MGFNTFTGRSWLGWFGGTLRLRKPPLKCLGHAVARPRCFGRCQTATLGASSWRRVPGAVGSGRRDPALDPKGWGTEAGSAGGEIDGLMMGCQEEMLPKLYHIFWGKIGEKPGGQLGLVTGYCFMMMMMLMLLMMMIMLMMMMLMMMLMIVRG